LPQTITYFGDGILTIFRDFHSDIFPYHEDKSAKNNEIRTEEIPSRLLSSEADNNLKLIVESQSPEAL